MKIIIPIKSILILLLLFSCSSCEKSEAELEQMALHDPNPMRQRDAADRIRNDETLIRIFYQTKNPYVKEACVSGLSSSDALMKIAKDKSHSDSARSVAILRINDRNLAKKIIADKSDDARDTAVQCLSPELDEELIHSLGTDIKEGKFVRSYAILRMKDQVAIKKILETENDINIRLAAATSLRDEKMNEEMFYKETNRDVKINLIEAQRNQVFLKRVVESDTDIIFRAFSARNITDQNYLIVLAKNDKAWRVRQEAIEKIKDQKFIQERAINETDPDVRCIIVELLTDKDILKSISNNDVDNKVRIAASRRLRRL